MKFNSTFYQHRFFSLVSATDPTGTLDPDALDARMRKAFDAYVPQFAAIDPTGYLRVSVDVMEALAVVESCIPKVTSLRPQIVDETPRFAVKLVDELAELTLAVAYTHGCYESATGDRAELQAAVTAATHRREIFLAWLEAISECGFTPKEPLVLVRRGTGFADVADDLEKLTAMLRDVWPSLGPRTLLNFDDLARADHELATLRAQIAARVNDAANEDELGRVRQAAFTVLARRWDEVRRVVGYLRWRDDDADAYAPSLWTRARSTQRRPRTTPGAGDVPAGNARPAIENAVADEAARKLREVTNPGAVPRHDPFGDVKEPAAPPHPAAQFRTP